MSFKLAAVAAAVAATLALAACGGGGGGGGGGTLPPGWGAPPPPPPPPPPAPPPPAPPPAPAPAPVPAIRTFMYEALPPSADLGAFIATLQSQGARGFRFLTPLGATDGTVTESASVFVKYADASYTYEVKAETADSAAFLAQANEAGARGFRWVGPLSVNGTAFFLYRKESDSNATYSYRADPMPGSKAEYLAQANALGTQGYYNTAAFFQFGAEDRSVFEKDTTGNATYGYELGEFTNGEAEGMAQFNEKGSRGFRFRGPASFTDGGAQTYVKDLSQSATFSYEALDTQPTMAALITQANAQGARNFGFLGPLSVGSTSKIFYYKPTNCAGAVVCVPTGPFGP